VRRLVAVAVLGLVAAGCTVGPDFHKPESTAPADYRGRGADYPAGPASLGDLPWWEIFGDPVLQELIREALRQNYDLRVAASRIVDARAQVTIARSFQVPELRGSGGATYSRVEGDRDPSQFRETFVPARGFDLSYEIDLWGRFRRSSEAARAELLATEAGRRFVLLTLVSDVAATYFNLRDLDEALEVARRTLASRRDSLRLVSLREQGGVAALIDVRQSEILVAQAAETLPDVERQIAQTENALAVLLGRNPADVPRGRPIEQQVTLPALPAGVPSALLERRPDIVQAEARLAAETARIGVAKSEYFPRVFLTGSAGAGGIYVNGSWAGPQGLFAIGPSFTVPLFNWGRVDAGVDSAEARAQAALDQYRQVLRLRDAPIVALIEIAQLTLLRNLERPVEQQNWEEVRSAINTARKAFEALSKPVPPELIVLEAEVLSAQKQFQGAREKLEEFATFSGFTD
jgi:multidrug efflux system outer membrane protein